MNIKITLLTASCALALAACGGNEAPQQDNTPASAAAPATSDGTGSAGTTAGTTPGTTGPGSDQVAGTTMPDTTMPDTTMQDATMPGTTGAGAADGTAAGSATATAGDAAQVSDCETTIEGNDAMQFNVKSIAIPSSCNEFTINLEHTGQLPEAAMGHNVVITSEADMQAVASDGLAAGADNEYVPQDDDRVIAYTDIIGGGENTSVTFSTSELQGGSYMFFCSFPGHSALMKGTISVE